VTSTRSNSASAVPSVKATAYDLLAVRDHSTLELRRKLLRRGFDDADVAATIAELTERGLLDDRRFAADYAGYRSRKGFGPLRIRAELRERGIADDAITDAVCDDDDLWRERLNDVAMGKFGGRPEDRRTMARQARFLEQRGFPASLIWRYIDRD
jgi:regulatory protein